jgi:DNA polymerase-1
LNKKIILIDGNNIAYRAFYALPATITTTTGTITNAVYGFTSMLIKLIEEQKPDVIICAFDSRGPTFRHDIYRDYKATRKKMPDELASQLPLIKEVLEAFNIKSMEMEGYEADDIIATISNIAKDKFDEVIIVSSDKDILQLISDNVKVLAVKKGITDIANFDEKKVIEKFGVKPSEIKDLLALMGDSSDNIPGITGIGSKTAQTLVEKYGSVEGIYKNVEKLSNEKLKELLIKNKEVAEQSKKLIELKTGLDIDLNEIIDRGFKNPVFEKIETIFNTLEFNTLKKRVKNIFHFAVSRDDIEQTEKENKQKLKNSLMRQKHIFKLLINALDKEKIQNIKDKKIFVTLVNKNFLSESNIDRKNLEGTLEGIIITDLNYNNYFITGDNLRQGKSNEILKELLEDSSIVKSGYDLKKIWKFLKSYNINLCGKFIDYKILYLLLNPIKPDTNLKEIIKDLVDKNAFEKETGEFQVSIKEDLQKKESSVKRQMEFEFIAEDVNKEDEILSTDWFNELLMHISFYEKISEVLLEKIKEENLEKLYYEIEEPLIEVLADIEFKGVNIDRDYLNGLIKEYDISIQKLTGEIYKLCDSQFNINSTQQLSQILYEKLKLQAHKKTKTGFSTNASALLAIYNSHPVIEKILDYREKVKLKNTYIDVLPLLIDQRSGRVHTTYNQLGTTTGRISSNNPNLQNIPIRTELGKQIRKAFIPGKGYDLLLSADYSQIELRILAHLSDDKDLVAAFSSGEDIHTRTASEIFGIPYNQIDESLRRKAKAINFGIIYGMTEFGLKSRLSISEEEAREYIKLYFARYPKVKEYINHLIKSAYKNGYTTTMFGRKRYINELATINVNIRNLGERLAVNTPIQGSAADIMKLATVVLYNNLRSENLDSNIILHVHDEIVLEMHGKDCQKIEKVVKDSMENCVELKTKLKVDIKTGKNWYI